MSLRGWLTLLAVAISTSVVPLGPPIRAEAVTRVTLTLPEAQALARRALETGNAPLAARVAGQILAVTPDDPRALLLHSAALTRSGQAGQGLAPARRAFQMADTPALRFEAAYLTAEAMAGAGRITAARLWLRRADLYSTGPAETELLARAYRAMAARSPWRFDLSLQGGPSDNVNGGSIHDHFLWLGIAFPIPQALPGWTAGGTARLSYRLPGSNARTEAQVMASLTHRSVWFSDEAKALAPAADARDFAYDEVMLGGAVRHLARDGKLSVRVSLQAGRRWQGGRTLGDVQRLDLGLLAQAGARAQVGLDLGVEAAQFPAQPRSDTLATSISGSWRVALAPDAAATVRLGYKVTDAKAIGVAWRGPSLGAEWQPAPVMAGISLSFAVGAEMREYWKTPNLAPDTLLRGSVTASMERFSVLGVAPTVTLQASRSMSGVVVRDRRDVGISFGLTSTF